MTSDKRFTPIINAYSADALEKIHEAKVLVVGAGGIGCEVSDVILSLFNTNHEQSIFVLDIEKPGTLWFP